MKKLSIGLAAIVLTTGCAHAQMSTICGTVDRWPDAEWPQARPTEGWDVDQLNTAQSLFEASNGDSVMIIHRGNPVAAWGPVGDPLTIQSMRKPVLGAVIGQLVGNGSLDLDATLADMNIQDTDPPLSDDERQVTLRDLLQTRSGIMHDANYEVGSWRRLRVRLREGEVGAQRGNWFYNNWDFNALGTIVQNAADDDLGTLVEHYLAQPLQMQDFDPDAVSYSGRDSLAQQHFGYGSDLPAYMFEMSTRDMARFGLLYLGCGQWHDEQVLSREWVEASWTGIDTYRGLPDGVVTGFDQYGYLWWIEDGGHSPRFRGLEHAQPFYGASGYRGHFTLVFPRLDLVIVHQPRTVGGITDEAQINRARNGSPAVSGADFQALVNAILLAHPER